MPYNNENGILKTFYPDFIIRQGNKIGIFDTKDGQTAKDAKEKAEGLQQYLAIGHESLTLWGGIVIKDNSGTWLLNRNDEYSFNELDLAGWERFSDLI